MNTHLSKVNEVLYALLLINVKRLNHYQILINKSRDMELKLTFLNCAVQAQSFCNTLTRWLVEVQPLKPVHVKKHFMTGLLLRVREFFFSAGRQSLLLRSEGLEMSTIDRYHRALGMNFLPSPLIQDLNRQAQELEETFSSLRELGHARVSELQMA